MNTIQMNNYLVSKEPKKRLIKILLALAFLLNLQVTNLSAQPGKDGDLTVSTLGQVVNKYSKVTANISAGATNVTVNSIASDLGSLVAGDLIMIYQAQGASIQTTDDNNYGAILAYNSSGLYEFSYVSSVSGNDITVSCELKNDYTVAGKTQVIKVPLYNNLTINNGASIAASAWNGSTGGILAIHVKGTLTNNGVIDVAAKGFRGGKRDNSSQAPSVASSNYIYTTQIDGAEKGESIAGYGSDYDLLGGRYGRGAPANGGGGGNSHNHGGGGGANGDNGRPWTGAGVMDPNPAYLAAWALDPDYIANGNALTNSSGGGRGGYSYSANNENALVTAPDLAAWGGNNRHAYCSRGGRPLQATVESRVFFGGGGGAGDGNNDASNNGGDGGGIAFVVAKTFVGSGTIKADGANGLNTVANGNDAPGGGGGGGTIVVKAQKLDNQTLSANGGNGGNQIIVGPEAEGCGGGGGGGVIATPPNGTGTCGITSNYIYVSGKSGLTTSNALTEFPPNGGTWGADGQFDVKVSPGFIPYSLTCIIDLDGDNVDDRFDDLDIDNDGIPNTVEGYNGISGSADDDNDLVANYSDPDFMPYLDTNCDGVNDIFDFDFDGIPDCIDLDSDNDGITDCVEAGGTDANGDGIIDDFTDANGDGLHDIVGSGLTGTDMDGDALMNHRDKDSDGDGITDCIEAGGTDANGDGIIDSFTDNDDDGYSDNVDPKTGRLTFSGASTGVSSLAVFDADSDSKKDYLDIDSDNDGITDNVEAQTTAGYRVAVLQDTDKDGIFDVYDTDNGGTIITLVNTDGADLPDYRDTDSDNDGVADNIEGNDADSDGNPVPALPVSTADNDGDGLLDAYDGVIGANVSVAGYGGTGSVSPIQDTDNDEICDWRDVDDDGDCISTATTGVGGENVNSNGVWNDDFDQNGAPKPNYLFANNSFSSIGASRCGSGSLTLNATSVNSGNFNWYTVATGGVPEHTQNAVTESQYSPSITATTNYYVDFTVGGCTSTRELVVASMIDNSFSPTVIPASVCGSGSVTLSASTGSTGTFRWYDAAVDGTLLKTENNTSASSYATPVISTSTTFYVEFDNGTCTGQRTSVTATVSTPPAFTVSDGYTCGTTNASLSVTAAAPGSFNWYTAATGGILLRSENAVSTDTYTASSIYSDTDFWVEYSDGCLAPRQKVTALVNAAIASPTTTNGISCDVGTVLLSASSSTSGTFLWYDDEIAGNLVQTTLGVSSDDYTTPSLSADKTYYVSYSNTQCTSARATADAFVIASANIDAPNVGRCGTGTVFLTATSTVPGTFKWYTAATGGTLLSTSNAGVNTSTYQTASITAPGSVIYYVEFTSDSPVCTTSSRKAVTATAATAPTVTPSGSLVSGVYTTVVCSAGTQTLTATSNQAGTFLWYDASSGGNLVYSETDNTSAYTCSFTTPYLSNSVDYYLEFDNGTCTSSSRQNVRINIIGASDPTVTENARCGTGTVNLRALSQTAGSVFKWYNVASGGSAFRTSGAAYYDNYTTPSISSTTTYYVEYTVSGCTSPRVPVTATINAAPTAPSAINGSLCSTGAVLIGASSATAANILWYSATSGGTLLKTENGVTVSNYTTPSIGATTTYYAETHNGTCASASRTAVNAIVTTGTAVVPETTGASNCGDASLGLSATNASSGVFRWYDAVSGGNLLKTEPAVTASNYTTPLLSSTTNYYVSFDRGVIGACPSSSRVITTATIDAVPSEPSITNNSRCGTGTVSLTATSATSGTFTWYDDATAGTLLQTDAGATFSTYTTPSISTNTSYYVAFSNGSCTSERVKATASVYSVPSFATGIDNSNCGAGSVSLSATSTTTGNFLWYDAPGGTLLLTDNNTINSTYNTDSINSNTSYYVYFNNGTCTSLPTTVNATINAAPTAPSITGDSRCGAGSLTLEATSLVSGTFNWFTAASGGALLQTDASATSSSFTTPSLASTGTYYVEVNDGSCSSTRMPVTAEINTCVTLSLDNVTIAEASGTATFTVTLSSISSQDVVVDLGISGTATGSGTDFTNGSTTITIPAGNLTGSMIVTAVDDAIYEGSTDETVIVDIIGVTNGTESTTQQQTTAITDNETANAVLSVTTHGDETGPVNAVYTVTLSTTNNTGSAITFEFDESGTGTATSGTDYTAIAAGAQISVANGASTGTISVAIADDAVFETTETIIAGINTPSNAAVTITGASATANITDDETADAVLSVTTHGDETGPMDAVYTVTLSTTNNTGSAITFEFDNAGTGTATSGTDYTAIAGAAQISVANGASTGTISVAITDDAVFETTETIIAGINTPSNAAVTITGASATANITDDETAPSVTLSLDNSTINETGSEMATITATLSNPSTQVVTVNLGFTGTTVGADYTLSSNTITIAAESTSGFITVTAIDDLLSEGNETVVVDITGVTNGTESGTQQVTTTIIDNDVAGISVSAISGNTSEAGATATFTIVLNTQPTADVTIPLSSNDLTEGTLAVSNVIFTSLNWNISQTVTVTGVDDPDIDGNISYKIITGASESTDGNYNGFDATDVNVVNTDNDVAPSIIDATISLNENTPNSTSVYDVNDAVTSNDTDGNGDAIQYTITAGNTGGAFTINVNTGEISVADATQLNFESVTSFVLTIEASDGTNSDNATITINLNNVNDNNPVADDDTYTIAENTAVSTSVGTVSATDADGDALTYSITAGNTGTAFSINTATGEITVNDALDYETLNLYSLTVHVTDGTNSDDATITINITNLNDNSPVANNDTYTANQSTQLTIAAISGVLANDSDADGSSLTVLLVSNASFGNLTLNTDGSLTYLHNGSANLNDSFTYNLTDGLNTSNIATVTITVKIDNDGDGVADDTDPDDDNDGNPDTTDPHQYAPTATADVMTVVEGTSVTINVLTNDDFLPGANTTLVDAGTGTGNGTVVFDATTGNFTYTPAAGEEGTTVTVDYTVCNTAETPNVCETATISITVQTDNDGDGVADDTDPDDDNDGNPDTTDPHQYVPTATADVMTVVEGTSVTINVLTNDDFLPGANTTLVDAGTGTGNGTVVFDATTGTFTYTPIAGEEGTTVTVDYTVCNTAETPNVCANASITITVYSTGNTAPVANNDVASIIEDDATVTGNVLTNDTDTDGDLLTVTALGTETDAANNVSGTYGSLDWNTDGSFIYSLDNTNATVQALNNGETLTESFTYTVSDGNGGSDTGSLSITIEGLNDVLPVIIPDGFSPNGDGANDEFVIENIEDYPNNELIVYNRWGTEVYREQNYGNTWNGVSKNSQKLLPVGTYFYIVTLDNGTKPIKGNVYLKY